MPGMTSSAHDARGWGITRLVHDVIAPASLLAPCTLFGCRPFARPFLGKVLGRFLAALVVCVVWVPKRGLTPWPCGPLQVEKHRRIC